MLAANLNMLYSVSRNRVPVTVSKEVWTMKDSNGKKKHIVIAAGIAAALFMLFWVAVSFFVFSLYREKKNEPYIAAGGTADSENADVIYEGNKVLFTQSIPLIPEDDEIVLHYAGADVKIMVADADMLTLTETYGTDRGVYSTTISRGGGALRFENEEIGGATYSTFFGLFQWGSGRSGRKRVVQEAEIVIPSSFAGDLKVELGAGDAELYGFAGTNTELSLAAGDVEVRYFSGGHLACSLSAGDIEIYDTETKLEGQCAAGDVLIDGFSGSMDIECAAGDITVKNLKMPEFYFQAETPIGAVKMDFDGFFGEFHQGEYLGERAEGFVSKYGADAAETLSRQEAKLPEIHLESAAGDISCAAAE